MTSGIADKGLQCRRCFTAVFTSRSILIRPTSKIVPHESVRPKIISYPLNYLCIVMTQHLPSHTNHCVCVCFPLSSRWQVRVFLTGVSSQSVCWCPRWSILHGCVRWATSCSCWPPHCPPPQVRPPTSDLHPSPFGSFNFFSIISIIYSILWNALRHNTLRLTVPSFESCSSSLVHGGIILTFNLAPWPRVFVGAKLGVPNALAMFCAFAENICATLSFHCYSFACLLVCLFVCCCVASASSVWRRGEPACQSDFTPVYKISLVAQSPCRHDDTRAAENTVELIWSLLFEEKYEKKAFLFLWCFFFWQEKKKKH